MEEEGVTAAESLQPGSLLLLGCSLFSKANLMFLIQRRVLAGMAAILLMLASAGIQSQQTPQPQSPVSYTHLTLPTNREV